MVERAGTERILTDKMNYLAEQEGYDVVLLTYEQCDRPLAFEMSSKIRHVDLDIRYYPYYHNCILYRLYKWWRLDHLLRAKFNRFMEGFMPDIVVTTTSYTRPLMMIVKCPVICARVLESHIDRKYIMGNNPLSQRSICQRFLGMLDMHKLINDARKFDILVSLHDADSEDWLKYTKTMVITNVVHLNPTGQLSNLESKHVVFVGRYTIQKNIPELFKIWEIVYSRHSDWHLDLYGEGEMEDEIIDMSKRLHANIHVHKSDPYIINRYLESSIFVLTSLYEPFGLVLPEAMSCGLPVVAFDCPYGPAHIITDGVDGYLVKERDIEQFAERVCCLIESPELRIKIGRAAVQSSSRFSASNIMPLWVNLFQELIKNRL
jgi:glycosyltransferase involved in cell wall biosynthesis